MNVKTAIGFALTAAVLLPATRALPQAFRQPYGIESLNDVDNITPIREQILQEEEWPRWRKDHVVPEVMRRIGVDMWVIARNEGALYYSLAPANYEGLVSRRYDALVFYDGDGEGGFEALAVWSRMSP